MASQLDYSEKGSWEVVNMLISQTSTKSALSIASLPRIDALIDLITGYSMSFLDTFS